MTTCQEYYMVSKGSLITVKSGRKNYVINVIKLALSHIYMIDFRLIKE